MSDGGPLPGGDFRLFLQKIALQGFYALGMIEVPGAPPQEPNVAMARSVVADLQMLREKCAPTLDDGERMTLDKYIADLQMAVVQRESASGSA